MTRRVETRSSTTLRDENSDDSDNGLEFVSAATPPQSISQILCDSKFVLEYNEKLVISGCCTKVSVNTNSNEFG